MTEAESVNDVSFHQPQIVSEVETTFPLALTVVGGAANCNTRMQSGAIELGRRLLLAARAGDTSLVLDLMAKGAPFTNDWLGTSPLHLAASNAHIETCGVLLRAGVSRESRTKVERTPLHLAAYAGHADVAELLLQHDAQVDCRDMLRMTPLHWAAERGHAACCALLLRRGADLRARNKFRKTPPQLAAARKHADVLALFDEELKLREAARSVRAIVPDHPPEEPVVPEPSRPTIYTTHTVHKNVQDVKIKPKPVQEKTAKPEIKAAKIKASSTGTEGPAAALLRRHGITLLPADDSGTALSALQSGRTIVLSDAGKLMLKESEDTPVSVATTVAAPGGKGSRGMVLTATPVRTTPLGVKVFTVNNRMSVAPAEARPRAKIMTPQDLQQVKIVQLPADARVVSPRRRAAPAAAAPVKIIMNKSNFQRLVAGARPAPAPAPAAPAPAPAAPAQVTQTLPPEAAGACSSLEPAAEVTVLRSLLAQAQRTIGALSGELRAARARLARLEQGG